MMYVVVGGPLDRWVYDARCDLDVTWDKARWKGHYRLGPLKGGTAFVEWIPSPSKPVDQPVPFLSGHSK